MFLTQAKISEQRVDNKFTRYLEQELYLPAYEFKRHWMEKWFVYMQMYNGSMWENIECPDDFVGVLNITETTVNAIVSELLSLDRNIKLSSYTLEGVYRADKMQTFLRQEHDAARFPEEFLTMQLEKTIKGGSFYKLGFNEDAVSRVSPDFAVPVNGKMETNLPVGRVSVKHVRPELIFPEPNRGTLKDCGYVVEVEKVRLSEIVRRYDVQDDLIDHMIRNVIHSTNSGAYKELEKKIRSNNHYTGFGKFVRSMEPYCKYDTELLLMHAYIKDESVMKYDIAVHDHTGNHQFSITTDKKVYPTGRIVTWYGDVILEDVENPWDFSGAVQHNFPFVYEKFTSDGDSRVFWGRGKVESMLGLNIDINYIYSQLLSQIGHMGNGQWLYERGAIHDLNQLNNEVGALIETTPGAVSQGKLKRMQGLPPEQGTVNFLSTIIGLFDKQTGRVEVTQGVNPSGVNTFRGIMSLLDSANKKLLMIFTPMDNSMSQLGKMSLCIIADFYQGIPRVLSVEDKNSVPSIREFVLEILSMDKYSYQVRSGFLSDKTKDQYAMDIIAMLTQSGAIDPETMLEMMDFENVSEIIDRMKKRKQEEEEMKRETLRQQSEAQQGQAVAVEQERGRNAMAQEMIRGGRGNAGA